MCLTKHDIICMSICFIWASSRYDFILLDVNNKGTGQLLHMYSMSHAFNIHFLESLIAYLAAYKISILKLVSEAEQVV